VTVRMKPGSPDPETGKPVQAASPDLTLSDSEWEDLDGTEEDATQQNLTRIARGLRKGKQAGGRRTQG